MLFYLYIYYFYAPEDIQFGKKLSNHPIKPHFRPLLGRFVAVFRSPHFLVFRSSRVPPSFFLTHPDQSVPCSDYSTLQIGYTNFFQTAFSSSFFIPTPRGFLRNFFCKCPVYDFSCPYTGFRGPHTGFRRPHVRVSKSKYRLWSLKITPRG